MDVPLTLIRLQVVSINNFSKNHESVQNTPIMWDSEGMQHMGNIENNVRFN